MAAFISTNQFKNNNVEAIISKVLFSKTSDCSDSLVQSFYFLRVVKCKKITLKAKTINCYLLLINRNLGERYVADREVFYLFSILLLNNVNITDLNDYEYDGTFKSERCNLL